MTKLPLLVLFIGAALIGTSTFFVATMTHNGGHGCPISLFPVGDCPPSNSILVLATHHISQLQNLTQATASWDLGLLLMILIIMLSAGIFGILIDKENTNSPAFQKSIFIPVRKFFVWLIFKNRRDPAAVFLGAL